MKLQIEKMVYGGSGLGRIPSDDSTEIGRTLFIPFTLPGEIVEAEITSHNGAETENARLLRILRSSPERTAPQCMHFGTCGGCHYQHASYPAQVAIKASILRETLERAGVTLLPEVLPHTAAPWGYRNRIRMRLEWTEDSLNIGYSQRASARFLDIQECPIAAPLLFRAAQSLCGIAAEAPTTRTLLQQAAEVELFCNADESRLQLVFYLKPHKSRQRGKATGFDVLCESLKKEIPELSGAGLVGFLSDGGRAGRRAQRTEKLSDWGAGGLNYNAGARDYWVARGGFFQVNRFLIEDLLSTVTSGRSGSLAWDLYAGVGLFSRALADTFDQVVVVEGSDTAAAELIRLARRTHLRAVHASTQDFLSAAAVQRERPGLIVADPPRAGLGDEVCALLARIAAPELVYVSCDPVTLARDLRLLIDSGYTLLELHLFDLFPQTFHMETVAVLRR